MVSTPLTDPSRLPSPNRLSQPSRAPPILPPLPANCRPFARSSSPRHHLSAPPPSSSTSRPGASRSDIAAPSAVAPTTPPRRRRQDASFSRSLNPPVQWSDDTIAINNPSSADSTANRLSFDDADDELWTILADHEFSSPSSYPSFTTVLPAAVANPATSSAASAASPRRAAGYNSVFVAPSSSTTTTITQPPSTALVESQPAPLFNEDGDEPLPQSSIGSFPDMMPPPPPPPPRAQPVPVPVECNTSPLGDGTRRTSPTSHARQLADRQPVSDDDLFADCIIMPKDVHSVRDEDLTTIDLTEATDVPEALKKPPVPKEDNRIKISKFQCVICMDDASTLTVTHCGHLYCAQCLHSSLHVEATKNKCPMCRAKIDVKSRAAYSTKTKGFWPLELKLMTSTRKGKRKADNIS